MSIRTIPAEQQKLLQIFNDGLAAFDVARDYIAVHAEPSEETERVIGALRRIEYALSTAQLLLLEGGVKEREKAA